MKRLLLVLAASLVAAAPAAASGPPLTVSKAKLSAAYKCPIPASDHPTAQPVMFVTGTGATGDQGYLIGQDAFEATGNPVCYMNYPDSTTADIQVSVQYLVYGLRRQYAEGGHKKLAVIGISQGGLLPRFALTYWPDLREKVTDVVAAAGTQHGTTVSRSCSASTPCAPANWQQLKGSDLLKAINAQPDETPGDVSYTTVRSSTDQTVQPQTGKHPTSALKGASNVLIQDVCPGRETSHIGTAVDSVTFALFQDALVHDGKGIKGAGSVKRLPSDVCDHPYGSGFDEAKTTAYLAAADSLTSSNGAAAPKVSREPKVRKAFERH